MKYVYASLGGAVTFIGLFIISVLITMGAGSAPQANAIIALVLWLGGGFCAILVFRKILRHFSAGTKSE